MEISTLDKLYCYLELLDERQKIMNEWYWLFSAKEHMEIKTIKKDIKKQIRKELSKYGKK